MRETMIVLRRELKSYFLSPIAYVFGALLLGVQLYLSATVVFTDGGRAGMEQFFHYLTWAFLVFLPILTMRLWSEERKLGTLELLMTFPVTPTQLILGKYFAVLVYLVALLVLTLGYPITLSIYGALDWGPVIAAYIASLLMAGAYVALGMFCSSLTRDQIIACIVAIVALLGLFFLGQPNVLLWLDGYLPSWLVAALGAVSPYEYFNSISRGVLDTRDFIYYACFCAFFLHMNALVLQGRRLKG